MTVDRYHLTYPKAKYPRHNVMQYPIQFHACKNVTISGNQYADGATAIALVNDVEVVIT
jgi:hypothetical protein